MSPLSEMTVELEILLHGLCTYICLSPLIIGQIFPINGPFSTPKNLPEVHTVTDGV